MSARIVRMSAGEDVQEPSAGGLFGTTSDNSRSTGTGIVVRGDDRMRFVGAAARRISRSMDLDEILLALCRATVPAYADLVLVYLREPLPVGDERVPGQAVLRLRRVEQISDEAATLAFVREGGHSAGSDFGRARPSEVTVVRADGPLAHVLRGVRPVFGDMANSDTLSELVGEGFGGPSGSRVIFAPMRGRRRVVGIAVFLRRPDRTVFEADDLQVAAQLATQSALGIDKSLLYHREAFQADELQRTMLPQTLPCPPGVRLASRYLPAADTARVGGDWYDAIPLPGSRVALVVGDVMGHSMASAAIMGQLRTTAQTLAGLDLPPQEVLRHLDEQAQRLGTDRLATCLYAVYDPVTHRITVANAGHPPPILLLPGGKAEVLQVPPGVLIGVGGVDFEAVELGAPAGSTLVLYTDGLVESRIREIWTGIEQLRDRLAATAQLTDPPPLEATCDAVLDMLGPGDRDDDIALLAARFEGLTASDVAQWSIDSDHRAPHIGRRLTRQALDGWGLAHLSDSAQLLVSELVTNAVNAAAAILEPIEVRMLRTHVLRCEVQDRSTQMPRQLQVHGLQESGRGLAVVNQLADRWGVSRLVGGKVVWFEMRLDGPTG
ncbi:SpoIIE family protein phosphatase [Streptomyces sp. NPDC090499]|uniref:ATP-binding SpoIIE family protein phosphatase n=1 Tax=Streptomyces sp. NPDC090499 TaxID=3365965 RepID=UPI00381D5EF9